MYQNTFNTQINDNVWEILQSYIPNEKPGGRPRDTDIRMVVDGILFVLNNKCSWRKLPDDVLPWQTVYDYYRKWRLNGIWETLSFVLVENQILDEIHLPDVYATV